MTNVTIFQITIILSKFFSFNGDREDTDVKEESDPLRGSDSFFAGI